MDGHRQKLNGLSPCRFGAPDSAEESNRSQFQPSNVASGVFKEWFAQTVTVPAIRKAYTQQRELCQYHKYRLHQERELEPRSKPKVNPSDVGDDQPCLSEIHVKTHKGEGHRSEKA
jgi:hypothetical protein